MDNPMWNAILRWSLSQTDPAAGGAPPPEMSEEDRAFLDKVFKSMVVDVVGRLKRDVMVLNVPESKEGLRRAAEALRGGGAGQEGGREDDDDEEDDGAAARAAEAAKAAESATDDEVSEMVVAQKAAALREVAELCENLDLALDFCKIGGLPPVLAALGSRHEPLPELAAGVLANMAQNNPPVQDRLLEAGALAAMLGVAAAEGAGSGPGALNKALLAVSALVDHHEEAMRRFVGEGGVAMLARLAAAGRPPRVRRKALVVARKVASQRPGALEAFAAAPGALDAVADAVSGEGDDVTTRELAAEIAGDVLAAGVRSDALTAAVRARLDRLRALDTEEDREAHRDELELLVAAASAASPQR